MTMKGEMERYTSGDVTIAMANSACSALARQSEPW
jgi:hypothetical protein